jgi:sigma-54 dependent transcriptional regulator, acetoin dehydrogenase operon transcriptional activator AcoR
LLRYFVTKRSLWLNEDVMAIDHRGTIVYGAESALQNLERRHRGLISEGRISFLKDLPATAWPIRLSKLVPNSSTELVIDHNRLIGAILVLQKRRQPSTCAAPRLLSERLLDFDEILGESAGMQETRALARKMSMSGAPILIEGETGVGKELFARAIQSAGPTAYGPFVPVNCGGMPRDLVGSELFREGSLQFSGVIGNINFLLKVFPQLVRPSWAGTVRRIPW